MKKYEYIGIMILILVLLTFAGCSGNVMVAPADPVFDTPAPAITAAPSVTPVPSPTPVAFEDVVTASAASCSFASDYEQVRSVLDSIQQPAADAWSARFAAAGMQSASVPDVSEIDFLKSAGDSIICGGNLLFVLDDKDLVILSVTNGVCMPISRTAVGVNWTGGETVNGTSVSGYEKTPLEIYSFGDRIAVVSDWFGYSGSAEKIEYTEYTAVDIYSISNPASPIFLSGYGQGGTYRQSVLIRGILYVVTDFPLYGEPDSMEISDLVPSAYVDGSASPLTPDRILLPGALDAIDSGYTVLGAYHLQSASMTDVKAMLGTEADMDQSEDGLRFLRHRWAEGPSRIVEEAGEYISEYAIAACTDILRFSADDGVLALPEIKTVNGWIPDCGAMIVRDESIEYISLLLQGLFSPDGLGGILWRDTETGIRFGTAAQYDTSGREEDYFGEEVITWAGLLDQKIVYTTQQGSSFLIRMDADTPASELLASPVSGEAILPLSDDGSIAFFKAQNSRLTLSIRDPEMRERAARTFGSDHSNTLESHRCYFFDSQAELLGFAADDSYCFYSLSENSELTFRANIFLQDWAWNARAFRIGGKIAVVDTQEVFLLDPESMKITGVYTL